MPPDEHALLLGEIKAKIEMNLGETQALRADVNDIKLRLNTLETRAGTIGGTAGAVLGTGCALLAEKLKLMMGFPGA